MVEKKSLSDGLQQYVNRLKFRQELSNKYTEKIHNLSSDERISLIRKIIAKYNSKEYQEREEKCGRYECSNSLYWTLLEYGEVYGNELLSSNEFPFGAYEIDKKFIVNVIHGQGSVVLLQEVNDDYVFPHKVEEEFCQVFRPDGTFLIYTNNENELINVLLQIRNKKLKGFYVKFRGHKYEINEKDGRIRNAPNELFGIREKLERDFMGF